MHSCRTCTARARISITRAPTNEAAGPHGSARLPPPRVLGYPLHPLRYHSVFVAFRHNICHGARFNFWWHLISVRTSPTKLIPHRGSSTVASSCRRFSHDIVRAPPSATTPTNDDVNGNVWTTHNGNNWKRKRRELHRVTSAHFLREVTNASSFRLVVHGLIALDLPRLSVRRNDGDNDNDDSDNDNDNVSDRQNVVRYDAGVVEEFLYRGIHWYDLGRHSSSSSSSWMEVTLDVVRATVGNYPWLAVPVSAVLYRVLCESWWVGGGHGHEHAHEVRLRESLERVLDRCPPMARLSRRLGRVLIHQLSTTHKSPSKSRESESETTTQHLPQTMETTVWLIEEALARRGRALGVAIPLVTILLRSLSERYQHFISTTIIEKYSSY